MKKRLPRPSWRRLGAIWDDFWAQVGAPKRTKMAPKRGPKNDNVFRTAPGGAVLNSPRRTPTPGTASLLCIHPDMGLVLLYLSILRILL